MPKIMKNGIEYGGGSNIYSETETAVGVWYNNKTRYRKVITSDFNTNASAVTDKSIDLQLPNDVDKITVSVDGYITFTAVSKVSFYMLSQIIKDNVSNGVLYIQIPNISSVSYAMKAVVIVEYCKN